MKNKIVVLYMISLLLIPIATADELGYDNGPYSNGVRINKADYWARVRFTPTSDAIGGILQQVKIYWCNVCTNKTGKFSILIYNCTATGYEGNKFWFNSTDPNQLGVYQSVDVSSLNFVVGSDDFCVEVRSQEDNTDLYIFFGGNNSNVDRSYHHGYPDASWHSFVDLQEIVPSLRELAIRAIVTETTSTTTTTTSTTTTTTSTTTTTITTTTTTTTTTSTTIPEETTTTTQPTTTTTRPSYAPTKRGGGGGGPYGPNRTKTCYDGIRNCHHGSCESGIDCGGPCKPCPSCFDGIQNQGEEGIDCGGPCEKPCPAIKVNVTTTITTTSTTSTTIPEIKLPTECGEGCDRTPHPENPFPDCSSCIVALDCQSLCGVDNVCDSAQYCYKLGEDYYCGCCCQSTTTTTIETPQIVGRVIAFPPEGMAMIGIFILFPLLLFFLYKREKKKEREEG